jgi:hypothetical protein
MAMLDDLLNKEPHVISESLNDKIFLIYGEAGTRKTSVAAQFDNHLMAAFEIGYTFVSGVMAQPVQKWSEFKALIRALSDPRMKEKYKTIIIDTVTLAYSACNTYILQQNGVEDIGDMSYGKGWRKIRSEFESAILSIPQMGYGLVLIAHASEIEEEENFRAKVDIDKRPAAIIKGLADFIIYVQKDYKDGTEPLPENQTVYAYTNLVSIETKTRSRYMPAKFEFTYDNLKEALKTAIDKQKEAEGIVTTATPFTPYLKKEVDVEVLKQEVADLAAELLQDDCPANGQAYELITDILDVKITEATAYHADKLEILKEGLLDIKSKL